jgi:hypothetical protein
LPPNAMSGVVLAAAAMQVKMRAALGRCLKSMGYDPWVS